MNVGLLLVAVLLAQTPAELKLDEVIDEARRVTGFRGDRRAELMFRLAELYFEKAAYRSLAGDHASAERARANALVLKERVLTEHPTYERNDQALFALAIHETDEKAANARFAMLIQQFPDSHLAPDAHFALGEYFEAVWCCLRRGEIVEAILRMKYLIDSRPR